MLERKDLDAVFVSTPDHWHAPAAVMAMQAGKDVYCEKPMTHNIREGRVMVNAARKYNRIVQTGSQQRSAPHFRKICEMIQSGYVGKVSLVEAWNFGNMSPRGYGAPPDTDPPKGLDWDLFLGPAPKVAYNRNRFHFNYRWFWDYSGGMMTDWGAHHMDIVHWAMGVDAPLSVAASGGRFVCRDNTETPDTLTTVFDYPGFTARYTYRAANGFTMHGRSYGMAFYGDKGTLLVDRASYEVIPEVDVEGQASDFDRVEAFLKGGEGAAYTGLNRPAEPRRTPKCEAVKETGIRLEPSVQEAHVGNWLSSIRTRQQPIADVEIGHRTVTACHLGVIAYRLGRKINWDARNEVVTGDAPAQKMTTRQYRKPYILPET